MLHWRKATHKVIGHNPHITANKENTVSKVTKKNLRDLRKVLENHATARAADLGIKMSAAVLGMATEMKVDRKTLKDFIEGTVAKPSSATMQKFDGWRSRHIVSSDKSAQPKAVAIDPRDKEIAELKDLIKSKDQERENLRLKYVETMRKLEGMESLDPRKAEQYQVVDAENAYWMQNSDAYIQVFTHNEYLEERMRLFTVPLPSFVESMPTIEDESHDEWKLRLAKLTEERKQLLLKLSDQIADLYETCGFPDHYVAVDVVTSRRHIG
tara:strand:+ start:556 stop:1362 length:807 start_codon:yes stop_codon:yes gene_type:complete